MRVARRQRSYGDNVDTVSRKPHGTLIVCGLVLPLLLPPLGLPLLFLHLLVNHNTTRRRKSRMGWFADHSSAAAAGEAKEDDE